MRYFFQLRCIGCRELFQPVVATSADELLMPDFDDAENDMGAILAGHFRSFWEKHVGHGLEAIPA
jgi:hypothetical protein